MSPFGDPLLLTDLAVAAEDSGWDAFFIWDHLVLPVEQEPGEAEQHLRTFGGGQSAPVTLRCSCDVRGRGDVVRRAVRDMPEYAPGRWHLDRNQFPGPGGDGAVR